MATLTGYIFADLESVTVHGHSLQVLQQGHSVAETPNIRGNVDHSSLSLPFCLVAFLSPVLLQLQMVMALVRKSRHLYMNLLAKSKALEQHRSIMDQSCHAVDGPPPPPPPPPPNCQNMPMAVVKSYLSLIL